MTRGRDGQNFVDIFIGYISLSNKSPCPDSVPCYAGMSPAGTHVNVVVFDHEVMVTDVQILLL